MSRDSAARPPRATGCVGNLCVDELLWRARLPPRRSTAELTSGELGRLHRRMLSMLRPARGSWLTGHRDEAQAR